MPTTVVGGIRLVKSLNESLLRILYNYYYEPDCDVAVLYTHWVKGTESRTKLLKCLAKLYNFLKKEAPKLVKVRKMDDKIIVMDGRDRKVTYHTEEELRKDVPMYKIGLKILKEIAEIVNAEEVD